jgi:ATP-dependent exoDNAse (exonuclease V) beta subunit
MRKQGNILSVLAIPALKEYFNEFEVVSVEEDLFEPIREYADKEFDFKGFIDLVVKTSDGKYHILDWKTCSWGWNSKKRSDPMVRHRNPFCSIEENCKKRPRRTF